MILNLSLLRQLIFIQRSLWQKPEKDAAHHGGADDELCLRRNTEAFADYELLPSQLSDVSNVQLGTTLFGHNAAA